jgi:hypothetical protein
VSGAVVCSLSAGLDDMKRKDQRDPIKVLRVLSQIKRFSVFEATDNAVIARTMTKLFDWGLAASVGGAFPWTNVEVTPKGLTALEAGQYEPPPPPPFICQACGREPQGRHVMDGPGEGKYTCAECWLRSKGKL